MGATPHSTATGISQGHLLSALSALPDQPGVARGQVLSNRARSSERSHVGRVRVKTEKVCIF